MTSRIAILLPSLAGGGVQRSFLLLAAGFLDLGLSVDLVVGTPTGPFINQLPPGLRLVDLHARHMRSALPPLLRYLRYNAPNALLSAQTHTNILAAWASRLYGHNLRLVLSEHNDMAAVIHAPGAGLEKLRPLFARLFYPWANHVVAVSDGVADSLAALTGLPRSSLHVIYNPLIPPNLAIQMQAASPHPWLNTRQPPTLLTAGRLTPQKDHATLLHSLAILRATHNARLIIFGEGSLRAALASQVQTLGLQDVVVLPGFCPNLYAALARASVFVLSSAWEGFPSVLVEALACGLPVVSTACPSGPHEILSGGQFGRLVPVGQPAALATALAATLDSPGNLTAATGRAAQFSIERAVSAYLPLLLGPVP